VGSTALSLSLIICHVVQKPTPHLAAPMAVQTNSRIGMAQRRKDLGDEQFKTLFERCGVKPHLLL